MRKSAQLLSGASAVAIIVGGLLLGPQMSLAGGDTASAIEQGKAIAFDRKKGNCLACHLIAGGDLPGNIGPPLVAMKQRYPDKAKLRAQIWDSTAANPNSIMPPFGRHKILSEDEIDKVTEFIYGL